MGGGGKFVEVCGMMPDEQHVLLSRIADPGTCISCFLLRVIHVAQVDATQSINDDRVRFK